MSGCVLVTGGTRGIGRAIVERLLRDGRRVAFTFNTSADVASEFADAHPGQARAWQLDLRDLGRPAVIVAEAEAAFGSVDALVNSAAARRASLVALTSDEDWTATIDANLGGAFRCTRAVLRGMIARRHGVIVNVSSLAASSGIAGEAAYAASKAGIVALTKTVAREMGRKGIRANAVVPGFVETGMTADLSAEAKSFLRAREALPRGTAASDVAAAVAFLLSEDAASITGQVLVVDAGVSA